MPMPPRVELDDEEALAVVARRTVTKIAHLAQVVLDEADVHLLVVEGAQGRGQPLPGRQLIELALQDGLLHGVQPVVVLAHGGPLGRRDVLRQGNG